MRKLLATAALAVAFISPTQAAPKHEKPDADVYLKVATTIHTVSLCVVGAKDKESWANAKDADLKYASDALFVLGFLQYGANLDEKRLKAVENLIDKYIQEKGVEAFCRENKPSLDKKVELMRKEHPDVLDQLFKEFPRPQ